MGVMTILIENFGREDRITLTHADGRAMVTHFPKKGPFPHDAVHIAVERALGLRWGFWGTVAGGMHPEAVQEIAKAGGHASASRATTPDPAIVELIQAERIVECFEAELWGGASNNDDLRTLIATACTASHVPPLLPDDATIAAIRADLAAMQAEWAKGRLKLVWG
jgi:hypothetical protein